MIPDIVVYGIVDARGSTKKGKIVMTNASFDNVDDEFTPKEHKDRWRVALGPNKSSGYDLVLLIENPKTKISYQLEVGLAEDGRLCGQITPDEGNHGPDALVLFDITPKTVRVSDNWDGPTVIIETTDTGVSTTIENRAPAGRRGFY